MKRKKASLIAVISIGLVFVLGICFLKLGGQKRQDKHDGTQSVTVTEPSVEPTTEPVTEPTVETSIEPTMEPDKEDQETGATQESQAKNEQQEEQTVLVVEDEGPSEEEIAALDIQEDMLAYWLVLNNKKPFVSTNEEGQKFFWNEYYWYLGSLAGRHQADLFMIVDMDGDGANEVVLECSPEATQVLHYEDGEVYSYQFVFRGMNRIHKKRHL